MLIRTVFNSISTTMVQPEVLSNLIATAETFPLGRKEVDDELHQQRSCSSAFA